MPTGSRFTGANSGIVAGSVNEVRADSAFIAGGTTNKTAAVANATWGTDSAILLMLAEQRQTVAALQAENTELRAEHNRGFAAGITAAAAELRQERDAIPHEADGSVAGVYDQAAKIVEALSS